MVEWNDELGGDWGDGWMEKRPKRDGAPTYSNLDIERFRA